MIDRIFSFCRIRNRAGIQLEIIEKQDEFPVYIGGDVISTFPTLDEAVSFARSYEGDSRHNG